MIRHILVIFFLLTGCGNSGYRDVASQPWEGGIYGVWTPTGKSKALVILHQGHSAFNAPTDPQTGEWYNLAVVAQQFAAAGYTVVGFEMPPMPHSGGPIERFYRTILDYVSGVPADVPIYMAGFSGGGWTTTVVTALEPRIRKGYSVQGDAPHYPSPSRCAELGGNEYEQCHPPHPYQELYDMAGARLMHVYTDIGGFPIGSFPVTPTWPFVIDATAIGHSWTQWTTDYILCDIEITQSALP